MNRHHLYLQYRSKVLSLAAAVWLIACSTSETTVNNGADAVCKTVTQSQVSATANSGSSIAESQRAFDSDLASFSTLTPAATNGGGTYRNALSSMRVSGTVAGAAFTTPTSGSYTISVTTYLGGTQQETGTAGSQTYGTTTSQNCSSNGACLNNGSTGQSYFGLVSARAFDAFQVAFAVSGSTNAVHVRELCVR